jgi:predicted secreted hydrolase
MAAIQQIPSVDPGLEFPKDYYGHKDCPTEWFWHIGTLEAADGRKFGFEINTANFSLFGFTQIEITDVQKQVNYQKVNVSGPPPKDWVQTDPTKPWYVTFEGPANDKTNGAVHMTSVANNNPLHMLVDTTFTDKSGNACELKLDLEQKGPPLKVWGTGSRVVDPKGPTPLFRNNYYYSFTNLHTKGIIKIGKETIEVTGITWMDHEYGFFPTGKSGPVIWMLQDLQLDNGMTLSNYTAFGVAPKLNVTMDSNATILLDNGKSIFVDSKTTPMGPVFKSAKGIDYYMQFKVEINCMQLQNATFIVQSLHPDQLFVEEGADVYEGVGQCWAHFGASNTVSLGKAWIEQNLGK